METVKITVAEVRPPQGKGPYKIIDTVGATYSAWAETGPMFKPGQDYSVDYDERSWTGKDGVERLDYVVKKARQLSFAPYPGPVSEKPPASAPRPQQNGVGFRPSMSKEDGMKALRALLCQAYAQAGIVPSDKDVELLIVNVTRGVANADARTASPQRDGTDIQDEVPY
jgi:hypothetical protein